MRTALFASNVPPAFAIQWLRERLFEQKPAALPLPVAPTRNFCLALLTSKIEATIGSVGVIIGWESDHDTVGPIATAAKQSPLRLCPHLLLSDSGGGNNNMSITKDAHGQLLVTSMYDWVAGCLVPALLSDPLMAVAGVDLDTDETAAPAIVRSSAEETGEGERAPSPPPLLVPLCLLPTPRPVAAPRRPGSAARTRQFRAAAAASAAAARTPTRAATSAKLFTAAAATRPPPLDRRYALSPLPQSPAYLRRDERKTLCRRRHRRRHTTGVAATARPPTAPRRARTSMLTPPPHDRPGSPQRCADKAASSRRHSGMPPLAVAAIAISGLPQPSDSRRLTTPTLSQLSPPAVAANAAA